MPFSRGSETSTTMMSGLREDAGQAGAESRHHDSGGIGGGGADSDYQAAGLLGYELNKKCSLVAGYRYMAVNYGRNTTAGFVGVWKSETTQSGFRIAGGLGNLAPAQNVSASRPAECNELSMHFGWVLHRPR